MASSPHQLKLRAQPGKDIVRLAKFTNGALAEVAKRANAQKTGARGLRAILESVMLELMYEIPSAKNIKECVITEEVIHNTGAPILVYDHPDKGVKSA